MDAQASPHRDDPPVPARLRAIDGLVRAATSWLALTLAIAVAPALAVWPLLHFDEIEFVLENKLDSDLRVDILEAMALSAVCVFAFYVATHFWLRSKRAAVDFATTCRELNRYTFVTLTFPIVTGLLYRDMEAHHEILTLTLIAIVTGFAAVFIYRLHELVDMRTRQRPKAPTWKHWLGVCLLFAFYGGYLSFLALLDHRNLGTHIYDLGIYDNIFWNTTFDDFLGCSYCKLDNHISAHFDPLIFLFTPIYRLAPDAETILVLQSVWLGMGVFPLFLLAQRRLGNPRLALVCCAIYVLYPALHGVNLFDFHSLTMVVPTIIWLIYFIDSGAKVPLWIALALMLMTREDMPLLACFLGAYAMLQRRHLTGLLMVFVSLTYLAIVKLFIMPDPGLLMSSKESMSYAYFFEEMIPQQDEGAKGFVISLLTNPIYALKVLFKQDRIFFFMVLLQPLLFLPLLAARKRFMMIYGLLFLGLASRTYVFNLHFQYSSVLFPILVASLPDGTDTLARSRIVDLFHIDRRRMHSTILLTAFVSTALVSLKFGAMVPNDHFKAGWNHLSRRLDTERYEFLQSLIARIPKDAPVCTTSSLGPHVSSRDSAHKWPVCKDAEYALLLTGRFGKKDERRLERNVRRGRMVKIDGGHEIELYRFVDAPKAAPASQRKTSRERPSKGDSKDQSDDLESTEGERDDDPRTREPDDMEAEEEDDPREHESREGSPPD